MQIIELIFEKTPTSIKYDCLKWTIIMSIHQTHTKICANCSEGLSGLTFCIEAYTYFCNNKYVIIVHCVEEVQV